VKIGRRFTNIGCCGNTLGIRKNNRNKTFNGRRSLAKAYAAGIETIMVIPVAIQAIMILALKASQILTAAIAQSLCNPKACFQYARPTSCGRTCGQYHLMAIDHSTRLESGPNIMNAMSAIPKALNTILYHLIPINFLSHCPP
jgi:hypothetical protein